MLSVFIVTTIPFYNLQIWTAGSLFAIRTSFVIWKIFRLWIFQFFDRNLNLRKPFVLCILIPYTINILFANASTDLISAFLNVFQYHCISTREIVVRALVIDAGCLYLRKFLELDKLRIFLFLCHAFTGLDQNLFFLVTRFQIIRKAMRELESIGYLDYQEVKKGRDIQFQIFKRSPKLALAKQGWKLPGMHWL